MPPEIVRNYAFCYLGRLRYPEKMELLLALLPESRRQTLMEILDRASRLTDADVASRLRVLREQVGPPKCRAGLRRDQLSPGLKRFLSNFDENEYAGQGH